ncbi:MAG: porin family protein [Alphaproteobacteria bacterium]|nr:porin family protein [Alphaproteobacteria bacterium]
MKKTLSLMAAVSAFAFMANANATEYTPYVAADYTYSDIQNLAEVNGGKIALGTEYNKYFGTEVFYQRTGSDRVHSEGETDEYALQSYGLDIYGYLPLGCDQVFALVGTAGIANMDIIYKNADDKRNTENGWGYRLGAGVEYDVNSNVSVRALYRYIATDKLGGIDHVNEYSLGVKYAF